ncbi:MAG TPA: M1 family metallopeptidase [Nakamurella sp.]
MPTSRRRPIAALALALLSAVSVSACSQVGGTAAAGASAPARLPSQSPSASSSAPSSGGITVPSTRPTAGSTAGSTGATADSGNSPADGTVGADGIGDPYYPTAGNGGYQVDGYDLNLQYLPQTNALTSTATITGSVTSEQGLSRFNLDLQPNLSVSAVTVNQAPATFDQQDAELVITPSAALPAQSALTVTVAYSGSPDVVSGGTSDLGDGGWYRTGSGGAFVAGEPTGASSWFPVNEHPADTATFAVTATVPLGWQVISNGVRQTDGVPVAPAGMTTTRWTLDVPVASYLDTIYIDKFSTIEGTLSDGRPVVSAIAPDAPSNAPALARQTAQVIDVLSGFFGPYPMPAAGGIFTGSRTGFALETATRPVYTAGVDDLETVVHELAHQWYGDDVTVRRWSDICLNECFASYATWLYREKVDGADLDASWKRQVRNLPATTEFWSSPLVDMGAGNEFTRVYDKGPIALHALRREIGDDAFFTIIRDWPATYGGKNASFDDFETFVNDRTGQDHTAFMDAWFRGTTIPPDQFLYPGDLGN